MRVIDATLEAHAPRQLGSDAKRPCHRGLDRRDVADGDDDAVVQRLVAERSDAAGDHVQALPARRREAAVAAPARHVVGIEVGERAPVPLAVVDLDQAVVDLDRAGRTPPAMARRRVAARGASGLVITRSTSRPASASATRSAWARPRSVSAALIRPSRSPARFGGVSPWRTNAITATRRRAAGPSAGSRRGARGRRGRSGPRSTRTRPGRPALRAR